VVTVVIFRPYTKTRRRYKTIDLSNGGIATVLVMVTLEDGTTSVVEIGSAASKSKLLDSVRGWVGPAQERERPPRSRDLGEMFALGYRSADATVYVDTKKLQLQTPWLRRHRRWELHAETLAGSHNGIRDAEKSKNLRLPPHGRWAGKMGQCHYDSVIWAIVRIDYAKKSRSFAIWVEERPGGKRKTGISFCRCLHR
jgi:hypothetical protein